MATIGEIQSIYELHKKGMTNEAIAKKISKSSQFVGNYVKAIKCYEAGELIPDNKQFSNRAFMQWTNMHEINIFKHEEPQETQRNDVSDVLVSDLSAKDKKELAMYAIDQYYFFLKQLTGVI